FGHAARDEVLQAQELLGALLLGDVARHAAIADEAAAAIVRGLAAHGCVAHGAVGTGAPRNQIAERRAAFQERAVRVPAALDLDTELPAPLAQRRAREGVVAAGAGAQLDAGEAVRGVLLPVPVVRQ